MADDVDLHQEILTRTLREVAQEDDGRNNDADPCVICLESVTEPGITVPCGHANFDFICLVSWLEQRPCCPLCKSDVTAVKYDLEDPQGPRVYRLPSPAPKAPASTAPARHDIGRGPRFPRRPRPPRPQPQFPEPDDPLLRRRYIYRHQLYSYRVGSNRLSRYREITPELFNRDEELVSRARKWIRRELRVFTFLNPDDEPVSPSPLGPGRATRPGPQRLESRRANNAEFLLEYIIAILRTVDIKGSAGQAEELLRDFLGRDNARLFLHELQAWLRSPYTSLEDWDRNVQYDDTVVRDGGPRRDGSSSDSTARSVPGPSRHGRRGPTGRVSKSYSPRSQERSRSQDALARARRIQHARDRYIPD